MMNNDDVAFTDDNVLEYKHSQIDLDHIHPVVVQMQGVLYDLADGITREVAEFLGIFYTESVSGNSVWCHACFTDNDTDIYEVNVFTTIDDVDFYKHLCADCAEGIADALEDYINDNMGDLLTENL